MSCYIEQRKFYLAFVAVCLTSRIHVSCWNCLYQKDNKFFMASLIGLDSNMQNAGNDQYFPFLKATLWKMTNTSWIK